MIVRASGVPAPFRCGGESNLTRVLLPTDADTCLPVRPSAVRVRIRV